MNTDKMFSKPKTLPGFAGGKKRTPTLKYDTNLFGKPKGSSKVSDKNLFKRMLG